MIPSLRILLRNYLNSNIYSANSVCPCYCRFCTRSYAIDGETGSTARDSLGPRKPRWENAIEYIKNTEDAEDISVCGGDSYHLSPEHLKYLGEALLHIPHVRRIRFATKGLAVTPSRILDSSDPWTDELINLSNLGRKMGKPVAIHTHINHPAEISWITREAAQKLFQNGVIVRNQSVLLKGINDKVPTMSALIRELADCNITPVRSLPFQRSI